jgi:hypothetical protein
MQKMRYNWWTSFCLFNYLWYQSKPSSLLPLGAFQKPHRVFVSPGSTR